MKVSTTEALRLIASRAGKSLTQLSKEMTKVTPASFVNMVARGSMKPHVMATFARHCGYKLVFIPEDIEVEDEIEIKGEDIE